MDKALAATLQEIDASLGKVHVHPEYSACACKEKRKALLQEAKKHSIALETRAREKGTSLRTLELHFHEEALFQRLNNAWEYLTVHSADFYSISRLGNLIDPEANPNKHFRRGSELEFAGFSPPKAAEVPGEIQSLVQFLSSTGVHPVIRAAEAHIEMVRIHPFGDGNGRAARLVQNYCLEERSYPAAIIPAGEREAYLRVLRPVFDGRYARETSPEQPGQAEVKFYSFIASKVLESVHDLQSDLSHNRAYRIILSGLKDRGLSFSVAHMLRRKNGSQSSKGVKVHMEKDSQSRNSIHFSVVGDVSKEEIEKMLNPFGKYHHFRYEIKSIGC